MPDPDEIPVLAEAIAAALAPALAERIAGIVDSAGRAAPMIDVQAKARQLAVSPEHVRRHALRLGGVNVGADRRPTWRFPASLPEKERPEIEPSVPALRPAPKRSPARPSAAPLLAVRERAPLDG